MRILLVMGMILLILGALSASGLLPLSTTPGASFVVTAFPAGTTSSPGNIQPGVNVAITVVVAQNNLFNIGNGCFSQPQQNCVSITIATASTSVIWQGGPGTSLVAGWWSKLAALPDGAGTFCPSTGHGYVGGTVCSLSVANATGTPACPLFQCMSFSLTVNPFPLVPIQGQQYATMNVFFYDANGQLSFRQYADTLWATASVSSPLLPALPSTSPIPASQIPPLPANLTLPPLSGNPVPSPFSIGLLVLGALATVAGLRGVVARRP